MFGDSFISKGMIKTQEGYHESLSNHQDNMVKALNAIHESKRKDAIADLKTLINQALKEIDQIKASLRLDKVSQDMYNAAKRKAGIH